MANADYSQTCPSLDTISLQEFDAEHVAKDKHRAHSGSFAEKPLNVSPLRFPGFRCGAGLLSALHFHRSHPCLRPRSCLGNSDRNQQGHNCSRDCLKLTEMAAIPRAPGLGDSKRCPSSAPTMTLKRLLRTEWFIYLQTAE